MNGFTATRTIYDDCSEVAVAVQRNAAVDAWEGFAAEEADERGMTVDEFVAYLGDWVDGEV